MAERSMPQNIEAEKAVLGSMLINDEAVAKVAELISAEDFYREAHRLVFNAMMALFDRRRLGSFDITNDTEGVDMVTVVEELRKRDELDRAGGIAYITSLAEAVPSAANVLYYANIVREKSLLRHLINAAAEIEGTAYEDAGSVDEILDEAEKKILAVSMNENKGAFTPIHDVLMTTFDQIDERARRANKRSGITGIPSGFNALDRLTAGWQPSDLVIIAARPSMGKTAFVLNVAAHVAARENKTVAFFSLEMSKEQLVNRMLCAEGNIDSQHLRVGELNDEDWQRLLQAADKLSSAPLFIDETPGITVMELRSKARRLKAEHGLSMIIIDYLQLMQGRPSKNSDNRQQEISEISRSLKALARELHVPVIALSQLSRGVESRTKKIPMLSDLRESGALEQDADIVMFLYRDDYYDKETERKNITDVIIAKHRNGPVDKISLFFNKEFTKFSNLEMGEE